MYIYIIIYIYIKYQTILPGNNNDPIQLFYTTGEFWSLLMHQEPLLLGRCLRRYAPQKPRRASAPGAMNWVVPGASSASYSRTTWVLCLLWHMMILCILCYVVVLRVEGNTINQPSGKWSLCRTMKQCLPMAHSGPSSHRGPAAEAWWKPAKMCGRIQSGTPSTETRGNVRAVPGQGKWCGGAFYCLSLYQLPSEGTNNFRRTGQGRRTNLKVAKEAVPKILYHLHETSSNNPIITIDQEDQEGFGHDSNDRGLMKSATCPPSSALAPKAVSKACRKRHPEPLPSSSKVRLPRSWDGGLVSMVNMLPCKVVPHT